MCMCVQVLVEFRVFSSSGTGVIGVCEPSDVRADDKTRVLCKCSLCMGHFPSTILKINVKLVELIYQSCPFQCSTIYILTYMQWAMDFPVDMFAQIFPDFSKKFK